MVFAGRSAPSPVTPMPIAGVRPAEIEAVLPMPSADVMLALLEMEG